MQTTDQSISMEDAINALVEEPNANDNSDDLDSAADALMGEEAEPDAVEGDDPQPDASDEPTEDDADEPESDEDEDDEGDEEYEADDDDEADQEGTPELHTVKVDGVEQEVTLDDLKQGFSGQAKIQKGMRDNAERSKQLEAALQQTAQQSQAVINLYNQLNQQGAVPKPVEPNYDDFKDDPLGYWEADAQYKNDIKVWNQQQSQLQQAQQVQSHQQKLQQEQYKQQQRALLAEKIPAVADPEARTELLGKFVEGAKHYGFSPEEVGEVLDHRAFLLLQDAIAYREMQAGKQKAQAKVQRAKKVVKAGASKPKSSAAAMKAKNARDRLSKSGHIDDAVDALLA